MQDLRRIAGEDAVLVPAGTLTWARERVAMSLQDAATLAKESPADLQVWENGGGVPLDVLRRLARAYGIPLSGFLWKDPKNEPLPTVDRRRYAGVEDPQTTPELAKALRRSAGLQGLAMRLHEELDAMRFEAVPDEIDPEALADQERRSLGVTVGQQLGWQDEWEAFRGWRTAVEGRGIYVLQAFMRNSDVRAFSLQGDPPVIVLDRSDWIKARIFSIAHEYAHVITGGSGICIPGFRGALGVESYCNRFAGVLLVPSDALTADEDAKDIGSGMPASDWRVKHIANKFKVSPAVMWYRLRQVGYISSAVFEASWSNWYNWRPTPSDGGGGQETAKAVVRDYGVKFPELLLTASRKGFLTGAEVSAYLGVRHDKLQSIENEIASRLAQ
jgi:Zn-dependent peptidase ImmA (M78 family)